MRWGVGHKQPITKMCRRKTNGMWDRKPSNWTRIDTAVKHVKDSLCHSRGSAAPGSLDFPNPHPKIYDGIPFCANRNA